VRKGKYIPKVGQEEYKLIILGTVTSTEAYSKAAGYARARLGGRQRTGDTKKPTKNDRYVSHHIKEN
jgi:hypothetical protein